MHKPILVNLFGSPSAGKSTTAAGVFYELKRSGIRSEYITEYAKSKVWEESFKALDDQIYVFAKQHHRICTVKGKVDVMITDSPLLLSLYYGKHLSQNFKGLVVDTYNEYDNMNYYIQNLGEFDEVGRMQTKEEASQIGDHLLNILTEGNFHFKILNKDSQVVGTIVADVCKRLWELGLK